MNDARRYRGNAADCLVAAMACEPSCRGLTASIASSWYALAMQDEAMDKLLASWSAIAAAHETGAFAVTSPGA